VVVADKSSRVVKEKSVMNNCEFVSINDTVQIFTVDVYHFFAETISKGKKNDHAMHNICLDKLVEIYKVIFREELNVELKVIIVWTDNAPHQYRCRQNFIKIASFAERHPGIKIIHRLAVVDNFKGFHDAVGKDPAHLVRTKELEGVQSPTGIAVFENCKELLEKTETKWKRYEEANDPRLKDKGKYGMNSRKVFFVVETEEEYIRLSLLYPGRILLCDRSFIQDTHQDKAINGTTQLHEIRSTVDTSSNVSGPRNWPVKVSNLPCNCLQ